MGQRDPFQQSKDDSSFQSGMRDEFSDLGETSKGISSLLGGGPGNRMRFIIAALVLGLIIAGGIYFYTEQEIAPEDELLVMDEDKITEPAISKREAGAPKKLPAEPKPGQAEPIKADLMKKVVPTQAPEKASAQESMKAAPSPVFAPEPSVAEPAPPVTVVAPSLKGPENGSARNYDETANHAEFTWTGGPGSWIQFSRNPSMQPLIQKVWVKGNRYRFARPEPGVWYWRIVNGSGKSEIRMFRINPPIKRKIALLIPVAGSTLAKEGGMVNWSGDTNVTYYRVEISNQGWANPTYRFATSGTQMQIQNVMGGAYDIRIGAFSEVSGRWEYTDPAKITIQ